MYAQEMSGGKWGLLSEPRYLCCSRRSLQRGGNLGSACSSPAALNQRGAQFTIIANVPYDTVRQDLVGEFRKFGRVELAMVVCDEASRHPHKEWTSTAGYAFVRFSKRTEAAAAIQAANMGLITIRGTRVRADWARKDSYAKRGRVSPPSTAAPPTPSLPSDANKITDQLLLLAAAAAADEQQNTERQNMILQALEDLLQAAAAKADLDNHAHAAEDSPPAPVAFNPPCTTTSTASDFSHVATISDEFDDFPTPTEQAAATNNSSVQLCC